MSYQHVQLLALFNSWYFCAITPNGIIIRRIGRVLYIVEGKAVSTELYTASYYNIPGYEICSEGTERWPHMNRHWPSLYHLNRKKIRP